MPRLLRPRLADFARAVRRIKKQPILDTADEDSARAVHELRVAARRAATAIGLFSVYIPRSGRKKVAQVIREARRAAGAVRDSDVHLQLIGSLQSHDAGCRVPGVSQVVASIRADREAGVASLRSVLRDLSLSDLKDATHELLRAAERACAGPTLGEIAAAQLPPLAVHSRTCGAEDLTDLTRLHALRLSLKRLRYAAEVFAPCLGESFQSTTYPRLEEAQRRLGEVNDVSTLVDRLARMQAEQTDPAVLAGISALAGRFAAVRDRRADRIQKWWSEFESARLFAEIESACTEGCGMVTSGPGRLTGVIDDIGAESTAGISAVVEAGTPQRNLWLSGKRLAVIDVGSNSIRLLAVELLDHRTWRVLSEERAMTRLAQGLAGSGVLSSEAMARSVEAIGRFKAMAEKLGAAPMAFATAAVREARNRADFQSLVQDRTGLSLGLVSAADEGTLTHRSVARVYDLSHGTAAVVDIGGGSVEVVTSRDGVIVGNTSMPLGAVRVTEAFGGADACAGTRFREMRRHIRREVRTHVRKDSSPPTIMVGCGGTFTTLLTLAAASRGVMIERNSPMLTSLGPVTRDQLRAMLKNLRGMTLEQRLRVPGLPSDRADIVVAGFATVDRLMKRLGASQLHVHPGGVREGLILRMIDDEVALRARDGVEASEADLLFAARDLAARCRYEKAHSEHVASLALSLYDQFRQGSEFIPGIGSVKGERMLLEAASVLHDVGIFVEYRGHHRHSETIIRHAGLPGWDERRTALVALVARYHRRAGPKPSHREFAGLSEADRSVVRRLAGILRVADGLDRSHTQSVDSVNVRFGARRVQIEVRGHPVQAADLKAATEKSDVLSDLLGVSIAITDAPFESPG